MKDSYQMPYYFEFSKTFDRGHTSRCSTNLIPTVFKGKYVYYIKAFLSDRKSPVREGLTYSPFSSHCDKQEQARFINVRQGGKRNCPSDNHLAASQLSALTIGVLDNLFDSYAPINVEEYEPSGNLETCFNFTTYAHTSGAEKQANKRSNKDSEFMSYDYKCPKCSKGFHFRSRLTQHLVTHSDLKKYKCDFCASHFKLPEGRKVHMIEHHWELMAANGNTDERVSPQQCTDNQEYFAQISNVEKSGASKKSALIRTPGFNHMCAYCDRFFRTPFSLKITLVGCVGSLEDAGEFAELSGITPDVYRSQFLACKFFRQSGPQYPSCRLEVYL
ncbi:hypothetical protein T265_03733 [Opisthorchis viverrini]|uniref:C2H2-type domain-containing protein n=1 Tax=Opisthorchis viverrini TaxID=6198 RepID=A0A074ZRL2_OPIVI|nr:hypothetical protein T265_03733 [Opisthorchis viverrini]KER29716.1 hypothetical protein T265_03733 [Opisthorchis viverrini]